MTTAMPGRRHLGVKDRDGIDPVWIEGEPVLGHAQIHPDDIRLVQHHYRGNAAKNAEALQHTLKAPRPTIPTPSGALL